MLLLQPIITDYKSKTKGKGKGSCPYSFPLYRSLHRVALIHTCTYITRCIHTDMNMILLQMRIILTVASVILLNIQLAHTVLHIVLDISVRRCCINMEAKANLKSILTLVFTFCYSLVYVILTCKRLNCYPDYYLIQHCYKAYQTRFEIMFVNDQKIIVHQHSS